PAVVVPAPVTYGPIRQHRRTAVLPGSDCHRPRDAGDGDGVVDAFAPFPVTDAVAELAVVVVAPGHQGAVGQQRQARVVPGGDRDHVAEARNLPRRFGADIFAAAFFGSGCGAEPELPVFVFAPRHHGAVGPQGEAVVLAGRDGDHVREAGH